MDGVRKLMGLRILPIDCFLVEKSTSTPQSTAIHLSYFLPDRSGVHSSHSLRVGVPRGDTDLVAVLTILLTVGLVFDRLRLLVCGWGIPNALRRACSASSSCQYLMQNDSAHEIHCFATLFLSPRRILSSICPVIEPLPLDREKEEIDEFAEGGAWGFDDDESPSRIWIRIDNPREVEVGENGFCEPQLLWTSLPLDINVLPRSKIMRRIVVDESRSKDELFDFSDV